MYTQFYFTWNTAEIWMLFPKQKKYRVSEHMLFWFSLICQRCLFYTSAEKEKGFYRSSQFPLHLYRKYQIDRKEIKNFIKEPSSFFQKLN